MLSLARVSKAYGTRVVVEDVSFTLEPGERLSLLGESGAGKTTTLRMINRLVEPSSGSIAIFGRDLRAQDPVALRRQIGYVIQGAGLFPHRTVAENVATVPRLLGHPQSAATARAYELLARFGLDPDTYAARYPAQLSGGQKQRVALARALAADPPLLLLDEPFGALDPITRAQVRAEFLAIVRELGKAVVLVTHDVAEAFEVGQRVCLFDSGKVAQLGTPRELLLAPETDFVRRFLADQQLSLRLSHLTIGDLVPRLAAKTDAHTGGEAPVIAAHVTLREALETALAHPDRPLMLSADGVAPLRVTPAQLLAAAFGGE